jgi:hypothetical protein
MEAKWNKWLIVVYLNELIKKDHERLEMMNFIVKFTFWYSCVEIIILSLILYEWVSLEIMGLCVRCWNKKVLICAILLLIVDRGNVYDKGYKEMKSMEIVKVNLTYACFVNVVMWWYNFLFWILSMLSLIGFSCAPRN